MIGAIVRVDVRIVVVAIPMVITPAIVKVRMIVVVVIPVVGVVLIAISVVIVVVIMSSMPYAMLM